jgi:hypothetical protein
MLHEWCGRLRLNSDGNRRSIFGVALSPQPLFAMSFRRTLSLGVGIAALVLSGCTTARTPADRIARDRPTFESWPAEVQQKVRAGEVAVGFSESQVQMALGKPDDVSTRTTAEGKTVVWTYRDRSPRVGFGIGVGGGGGGTGVGLGVGTSTGGTQAPRLRVIFSEGFVSAIEQAGR